MSVRERGEGIQPSWDVELHCLGEEEKRCRQSSCYRRTRKALHAEGMATRGASWNKREKEWAENTEVWYGGKQETGSNQFLQGTPGKEVRRVTVINVILVGIILAVCGVCESPSHLQHIGLGPLIHGVFSRQTQVKISPR